MRESERDLIICMHAACMRSHLRRVAGWGRGAGGGRAGRRRERRGCTQQWLHLHHCRCSRRSTSGSTRAQRAIKDNKLTERTRLCVMQHLCSTWYSAIMRKTLETDQGVADIRQTQTQIRQSHIGANCTYTHVKSTYDL